MRQELLHLMKPVVWIALALIAVLLLSVLCHPVQTPQVEKSAKRAPAAMNEKIRISPSAEEMIPLFHSYLGRSAP
jgi:hypothetical protein